MTSRAQRARRTLNHGMTKPEGAGELLVRTVDLGLAHGWAKRRACAARRREVR
jgi:hypothetical protein